MQTNTHASILHHREALREGRTDGGAGILPTHPLITHSHESCNGDYIYGLETEAWSNSGCANTKLDGQFILHT